MKDIFYGLRRKTIGEAIDELLSPAIEGGFQNESRDPGNYVTMPNGERKLIGTNYGVTPAALAEYRRVNEWAITEADIRSLTPDEATLIARAQYYYKPGFDRLPFVPVVEAAFDMGYNHGPRRAIAMLQRVVDAHPDGAIGPLTRTALASDITEVGHEALCREYYEARITRYRGIVARRPSMAYALKAWERRAFHFTPEHHDWWSTWTINGNGD